MVLNTEKDSELSHRRREGYDKETNDAEYFEIFDMTTDSSVLLSLLQHMETMDMRLRDVRLLQS